MSGPPSALFLFYFVTLSSEPIWVGWRAGQILLVTVPPLVAALFARLLDSGRRALVPLLAALALAIGLPTAAIDAWNAQDVENTAMGPGFRWTVAVPPDTQAAMDWIREHTDPEAVVQMSIGPSGRETWTLVPTFAAAPHGRGPADLAAARRRVRASGRAPSTRCIAPPTRSRPSASRANSTSTTCSWTRVERRAFGAAAIDKFRDPRFFTPVFQQGEAAVFEVR